MLITIIHRCKTQRIMLSSHDLIHRVRVSSVSPTISGSYEHDDFLIIGTYFLKAKKLPDSAFSAHNNWRKSA